MERRFLDIAYSEALKAISDGDGGPFGAVIVRDGKVVSSAHNEVVKTNDPTAHAEILAIRKAGKSLGDFNLSGCEIYSTCEPCPMCFSAIIWARIEKVTFVLTREDATAFGFDDRRIYEHLEGKKIFEKPEMYRVKIPDFMDLFNEWKKSPNSKLY